MGGGADPDGWSLGLGESFARGRMLPRRGPGRQAIDGRDVLEGIARGARREEYSMHSKCTTAPRSKPVRSWIAFDSGKSTFAGAGLQEMELS